MYIKKNTDIKYNILLIEVVLVARHDGFLPLGVVRTGATPTYLGLSYEIHTGKHNFCYHCVDGCINTDLRT
jgi:hypothetical protein